MKKYGHVLTTGATFLMTPLTKLQIFGDRAHCLQYTKGDYCTPGNNRGIAISNISCKLFCKILNARLNACLEKNSLIPCSQIGFRKNYRTGDHIVILKTLINK